MAVFSNIAEQLEDEIKEVIIKIPKILTFVSDAGVDAKVLLPELGTVIEDASSMSCLAIVDGGGFVETLSTLVAAAKDGNVEEALVALRTLITDAKSVDQLESLLVAIKKLVADVDTFNTDAKNALAKLEQNIKS